MALPSGRVRLLLVSGIGALLVHAEERDVDRPRIDIMLRELFDQTGFITTADGLGLGARFAILWRGEKRIIAGEIGGSLGGPEVVLPRGTLTRLDAECAEGFASWHNWAAVMPPCASQNQLEPEPDGLLDLYCGAEQFDIPIARGPQPF